MVCVLESVMCFKESPFLQKYKCALQTAKCLATKIQACGVTCIPPTVKCALENIFHPLQQAKCYTEVLVKCVKTECGEDGIETEEEKAAVTEVLSLDANTEVGSVVDDIMMCVLESIQCWKETPFFQKYKCALKTTKCLATKIQACGVTCIPPTVKCALEKLFKPLEQVKCYTETLINCVEKKCGKHNDPMLIEANELSELIPNEKNDPIMEC